MQIKLNNTYDWLRLQLLNLLPPYAKATEWQATLSSPTPPAPHHQTNLKSYQLITLPYLPKPFGLSSGSKTLAKEENFRTGQQKII